MLIFSTGLSLLASLAAPPTDTGSGTAPSEVSIDDRACAVEIDDGLGKRDKGLVALGTMLTAVANELAQATQAQEKLENERAVLDEEKTKLAKELAALQAQILGLTDTAKNEALKTKIAEQTGKIAKTDEDLAKVDKAIAAQQERIAAQQAKHGDLEARRAADEAQLNVDIAKRWDELPKRERIRCRRQKKNDRIEHAISLETRTFRGIMRGARESRCATALCWGPSHKYAFEPLAELPIGKSFASHRSGLGRYINGTDIQVSFNAGLRFWAAWDWVSVSVYLSKPLFTASDIITISGSSHQFSGSQVRRPFPGVGVGLFGDIVWLSMDWDQLRNGNTGDLRAPEFRPNDAISHTATFTFAIAPFAALRNGLGALAEKRKEDKKEEQAKAPIAAPPTDPAPSSGTSETPKPAEEKPSAPPSG